MLSKSKSHAVKPVLAWARQRRDPRVGLGIKLRQSWFRGAAQQDGAHGKRTCRM